jgi:hypothetical protein
MAAPHFVHAFRDERAHHRGMPADERDDPGVAGADAKEVMTMFGIRKSLRATYDEALARVPEALKAEGFGVLTEIDIQSTFKQKLGVEFRRYKIPPDMRCRASRRPMDGAGSSRSPPREAGSRIGSSREASIAFRRWRPVSPYPNAGRSSAR